MRAAMQTYPAWRLGLAALALPALALALLIGPPGPAPAPAAPAPPPRAWPMFGGTPQRNMANPAAWGLVDAFDAEKGKEKNLKWAAKLGSKSWACPIVADGRVFIGTNNANPRDGAALGPKGVLMCFRASDGAFLWQLAHDNLTEPGPVDHSTYGVSSSPAVDGDRLYYVNNRAELVCAAVALERGKAAPRVLWAFDFINELGVFPTFMDSCTYIPVCSPLVLGDLVFATTGNGADRIRDIVPAPDAPAFVAVNKHTGRLVWKDSSPGRNVMEWQWGTPAAASVRGQAQVIFPGGDGWLYSFEPRTGKLLWKFDCNPRNAGPFRTGGRGQRCYLVAAPVVHAGKLYASVGRSPDEGPGVGHLWCIDLVKATEKGKSNRDHDVSPRDDNFAPAAAVNKDSALAWHYGGAMPAPKPRGRQHVFGRSVSSVAVHGGLVYAAEVNGYLHSLDADTGRSYWVHDLEDSTLSSPFYADGKVFLGTEGGDVVVYRHGKRLQVLARPCLDGGIKAPPVAVNGTLYINTGTHLYAFAGK